MSHVASKLLIGAGVLGCGAGAAAQIAPFEVDNIVEARVQLDFADGVELRTLVDYVSRRLELNIVYDDALTAAGNTVTVRSPGGIPADQLLPFLQSVLRMKGFELVDGETADWKRVVSTKDGGGVLATTVQYVPLNHAEAAGAAQQVKQLLSAMQGADGQPFEVSYDARTNQVGLIGPADLVASGVAVLEQIDIEVPDNREPIRFHKLTNATAADVLDTIRALHGESPGARRQEAAQPASTPYRESPGVTRTGTVSLKDLVWERPQDTGQPTSVEIGTDLLNANNTGKLTGVAADPNTNTIIVMGGPEVQQKYEQLIQELDKRRPQVLLEATIVTLDTSNNYRVGVEIGSRGTAGDTQLLTFSQFGLSEVDPATGRLNITPGLGFNGAILNADVADVIVQALESNNRARVQSAPRILVNDNATGILASIAEQPFASVNASDTVATTSFGGYAEAGTTITLTPHISEGDYLQLEYAVELSNFTGVADDTLSTPPPRQTNRVESQVTIPDGSTIIVGGVNLDQFNEAVDKVPILGDIPILKYLFSSRSKSQGSTTLFVFLRPVILRDDQFVDLKNISERDLEDAGLPGNLPSSEPMLVR